MLPPMLKIALLQPVYAPSAISARGGKFRHLPGQPGYVTVSSVSIYVQKMLILNDELPTAIEDPSILIEQFKHAAINAKKAGFDGVERTRISCSFVDP